MLKEGMTAPDFSLDADDDTPGCTKEAYGAWGEKSMYSKTYEGVLRSTFVIGKDGVIAKAFPKVKPEGHAEGILALL